MANYSELLNDINAAIYENNDQEIDALEVRAILREMVTSLGSGFLFKGIATPSSPGTSQAPDQNVFYLATTAGTYTYLGGLVVATGEVAFLCYDGTWTKKSSALLSTGSIVDNTTTEDATKPLSAKQGKVLADAGAATAAEVTALGHKVAENATLYEAASVGVQNGLIGAADGVVYPGDSKSLYSDLNRAVPGQVFQINNPTSKTFNWSRAFLYNGGTFVQFFDLGTTIQNYTAPSGYTYDSIRFNFSSSADLVPADIVISTINEIPVKERVEENTINIAALEQDAEIAEIANDGYRTATDADAYYSIADKFKIENGSLYGRRAGTDPAILMLFNEGITGVEFEIAYLWDSNLLRLCFGIGVDTGRDNKECFPTAYMATSARPNDIGSVSNIDIDAAASAQETASIWGQGHFFGDYRSPQVKPAAPAVGDKCRIDLLDGHFFIGRIYNSTSERWDFWFCLDADGAWNQPNRMGWSTRKAIGFGMVFMASGTTWKELVKNLRVTTEKTGILSIYKSLSLNYPPKKKWVAIGDSITAIDKNNGLSYVGYAQRKLGFLVDNQGKGGWTIYKLWRERATAGWEDAVSAINDGDIVTIFAGTNDFDTANFPTPASDAAMDAAGDPHPRFGTTDPTDPNAKDPHTTLGCLRLMIEDILTLKPGARLFVFSPFYREKGLVVGSTSWQKLYINSDGKTIYDYADAIYSVAREYNLPAFNTCRDCGINSLTLAAYTYDDLHIGQVGGELIGDYVAKRID